MNHTPETRPTTDLEPHPILKSIPAPAKDSDAVKACAEAIRESDGHLLPIVIDEHGNILTDDSRLRWLGAGRAKLAEVPVIVQPGALAPVIALNAIVHRAHLTKSARAYLAVPLLKPAFEAARAHRLDGLKNGQNTNVPRPDLRSGPSPCATKTELAEKLGFTDRMIRMAEEVHRHFENPKPYEFTLETRDENDGQTVRRTLREHFEPKLLGDMCGDEHDGNRPLGLGALNKAIGYVTKGNFRQKGPNRDGQLLLDLFKTGLRFKRWGVLSAKEKADVLQQIEPWVAAMPDDLIEQVERACRKARKGTVS